MDNVRNLIQPPEEYVKYLKILDSLFVKYFNKACEMKKISKYIHKKLKNIPPYKCCENFDIDILLKIFIKTRLFFAIKFFNRDISKPEFRNKILKISNQ